MSEFDNFSQFKETDIRPEKFDGEHKKVVKVIVPHVIIIIVQMSF